MSRKFLKAISNIARFLFHLTERRNNKSDSIIRFDITARFSGLTKGRKKQISCGIDTISSKYLDTHNKFVKEGTTTDDNESNSLP